MSLKNLRTEIRSKLGIKQSPEGEAIEIRPGVAVSYYTGPTMFALDNFLVQSIGMWLWKYALCPDFEERVRSENLRKTIVLCYPNSRISNRLLGQIINSRRNNTARIQYGDFSRAYGWKWDGREDLATSMWLFARTWIYEADVVEWNNNTAVAPGDESRSAIEEELTALEFPAIVDAYYFQRRSAYIDFKKAYLTDI